MTQDLDAGSNTLPASLRSDRPFVSYAQNFEDVMLHRALSHVSDGRYLDIGAGEPDADSVTLAFYKANWRGINVEPLVGPYNRLAIARPEDVNLNIAVGSSTGEATLYVVGQESGLSTLDPCFAARYASEGWTIEERRVPAITLIDLCSKYVTGDIHFLKIDAEGAELDILKGADFVQWRPWIILVEATLPNSKIPSHDSWEDILFNSGYEFCYFDGLNRFYIAAEQVSSLRPAFSAPPNVTDNFVLAKMIKLSAGGPTAELDRLLHVAQERTDEAQARTHAAQTALDHEQSRVAAAEARVDHAQGVAHAAANRISELQEELRTIKERLAEATQAHDALIKAVNSLEAQAVDLSHENQQTRMERSLWAQELFEANRYAAELVKDRQLLLERCSVLSHHAGEDAVLRGQLFDLKRSAMTFQEQVEALRIELDEKAGDLVYYKGSFEAVINSTSWLLTKPIRMIGRLGRR